MHYVQVFNAVLRFMIGSTAFCEFNHLIHRIVPSIYLLYICRFYHFGQRISFLLSKEKHIAGITGIENFQILIVFISAERQGKESYGMTQ